MTFGARCLGVVKHSMVAFLAAKAQREKGFQLTPALREATITPGTRRLLLNSADKPSGAAHGRVPFFRICTATSDALLAKAVARISRAVMALFPAKDAA